MNYTWYIIGGVAFLFLIYLWMTYNKIVNLNILVERQAGHLQAHFQKKFNCSRDIFNHQGFIKVSSESNNVSPNFIQFCIVE